ncbi:hypothetical protein D3C72_1676640 [compost metagenome]
MTSISSRSSPLDLLPRTTARTRSGRLDGLRSASRADRSDSASGVSSPLSNCIVRRHAAQPSRQNPSAANFLESLSSSQCICAEVHRPLKFRARRSRSSDLSTPSVRAKRSINLRAAPYHLVTSASLRGS